MKILFSLIIVCSGLSLHACENQSQLAQLLSIQTSTWEIRKKMREIRNLVDNTAFTPDGRSQFIHNNENGMENNLDAIVINCDKINAILQGYCPEPEQLKKNAYLKEAQARLEYAKQQISDYEKNIVAHRKPRANL